MLCKLTPEEEVRMHILLKEMPMTLMRWKCKSSSSTAASRPMNIVCG